MRLLVVLLIAATGIWAYNYGTLNPRVTTTDSSVALDICNYSHGINSGEWEEACGVALDSAGATYLCNEQGTSCWIQHK